MNWSVEMRKYNRKTCWIDPKEVKREKWEAIIQEKMAENFPEVKKNMSLQFEKICQYMNKPDE